MITARIGHADRLLSRLLAPLCIASLTAIVTAQRFDNWVAAPSLPGACMSNLATDPITGAPTAIVFVGGGTDTVAWDGSTFVSLGLTNNPGGNQLEVLAPFRTATTAGLVHLDSQGNTSVWTGGTSWTSFGVLVPSPGARGIAAAASVPGPGGEAFLFGGQSSVATLGDLWSFNGTAWTNRTPTSGPAPSPRIGASLAYDGIGGLLLYGGQVGTAVTNDLWRWNGSQWAFAGKGPQVRGFHTAMLDISRSVLLVAGGWGSGGMLADAWTLPLPLAGIVGGANWTQISSALPFVSPSGFVTGALDGVRNEPLLADHLAVEVVVDHAASFLIRGQSPTTNCVVPNLQIITGGPVNEPRVDSVNTNILPIGGLTGGAGAPMLLQAEFVTPAIGLSVAPTPIPGTSCLNFLSPAASTIATTTTGAGGQYQFGLVLPPNPTLVGLVIDTQAFGIVNGQIAASQTARIVLGR
jgi:hypothetical protein